MKASREHLAQEPHRRFNALTGEWVLVSPHRTQRPWSGQSEVVATEVLPTWDEKCNLCPGVKRANGVQNPRYGETFVFTNDFSALKDEHRVKRTNEDALFRAELVRGTCRVMCFSPRHDLTLARMAATELRKVIDMWVEQVDELSRRHRWVQVFENRGAVMGCSNPHPHGQVWAGDFIPLEPSKELARQQEWYRDNLSPLLLDYAQKELATGERIVVESDHWLVLVPWWAVWPYETMVLPKRRHIAHLTDLLDDEKDCLALVLKKLLVKYDNLFETSFPYSMGWHGLQDPSWQLHAHFYPPLLRSASVKKFMVGYEMLAEPQRDITAETAAETLRNLSEIHYLDRNKAVLV